MSCVYFIHATKTDFVKIGIARDPLERLAELQVASPRLLRVLITIEPKSTPKFEEMELHRVFSSVRVRGEWFHMDSHLRKLIGRYPDRYGLLARSAKAQARRKAKKTRKVSKS